MEIHAKLQKLVEKNAAVIGLLVITGVLIYINCLPNELFWDDDDFILKNIFIQDWSFWPRLWSENLIAGARLISNYWRPLLSHVFAIEWHLWADWPVGWHAVSIAFHTAASIPLFLLIALLFRNRWLALLTAGMFLVHPAQTEAVVYANAMGDSLASFFVFWGLVWFARFRIAGISASRSNAWWLAFLCYPLALLSKETGILMLAFLALCDGVLQKNITPQPKTHPLLRTISALWPFALTALGYLLLRATVLNFSNSFNFYNTANAFTSSLGMRIAVFFQTLSTYAGILFVPYDLRVERMTQPPHDILTFSTIMGCLLFTALLAAAWLSRHKRPAVTFGILWFFVALAPTSNLFVIINAVVYEHFLYTALVGIWLAVFWIVLEWAGTARRQRIILIALAALFMAFSIRTIWRNTDWRTAIGFYEKLVRTAPDSYRVMNNLGMEYAEKGAAHKAMAAYQKAIALDPANAVAYHNIANIYRAAGQRDLAIKNFHKAIELQDSFLFSYIPLAQLYLDKGDYAGARTVLEKLVSVSEDKLSPLSALITIALQEKNYPQARRYLMAARQISPKNANLIELQKQIDQILKK